MSVREQYIDKRIQIDGGLCEDCKREPGVEVHHKTHLTPNNIYDPHIAYGFDNLVLLCWECHRRRHRPKKDGTVAGRYVLNEFGEPTAPIPKKQEGVNSPESLG